jgi:uncharacterized membrane protein YidH (DUF202 family)
MKKIVGFILAGLALAPALAFAQSDFGEVTTFVNKIRDFIGNTLIPLVFGIALLMFIWGVFNYMILGGADEDKRKDGRQLMIWAIIGFVVMVSVWGIVNMISSGLGFQDNQEIRSIPNVPTNNR